MVAEKLDNEGDSPEERIEWLSWVTGLDRKEIYNSATMDEVTQKFVFQKWLESASEAVGEVWRDQTVLELKKTQIPSWVIQSTLDLVRQDLPENKGSDLNDRYLACLAPYADETFVDKRTWENTRRARHKSSDFTKLTRSIRKSIPYYQIIPNIATEQF